MAPDSFKGSLDAPRVAAAITDGWRSVRPDDDIRMLPQADGGEGTLDAIAAAIPGAERQSAGHVTGPDGRPVPGVWLRLPDGTAVVELAQASGLPLMARPDPLGATTGGDIAPSAQESERSENSLADIANNLRGMRNVYLGSRDGSAGPSLSALVHAKSPSTDLRAREAFDAAEACVEDIPEPFSSALEDEPQKVAAAYEAIKTLKRVLAAEVLGTLGASLKFNDNDGD